MKNVEKTFELYFSICDQVNEIEQNYSYMPFFKIDYKKIVDFEKDLFCFKYYLL